MTRQMADDEVLATLDLAANDINALSFSETGRDWPYKADLAEARAAVAALQAGRDADKAALEALRGQVAGLVENWQWRSQGLSYVMDAEEANEKCADELAELLAIKERMG